MKNQRQLELRVMFVIAVGMIFSFVGCLGKKIRPSNDITTSETRSESEVPQFNIDIAKTPIDFGQCGGPIPDGNFANKWTITTSTKLQKPWSANRLCQFLLPNNVDAQKADIDFLIGLTFGPGDIYAPNDPNYAKAKFYGCKVAGPNECKNFGISLNFCNLQGLKTQFALARTQKASDTYIEKFIPNCPMGQWKCTTDMYETDATMSQDAKLRDDAINIPVAATGLRIKFRTFSAGIGCSVGIQGGGNTKFDMKFINKAGAPTLYPNQNTCHETKFESTISPAITGDCSAGLAPVFEAKSKIIGSVVMSLKNTEYGDVIDGVDTPKCTAKPTREIDGEARFTAAFKLFGPLMEIGYLLECSQNFKKGSVFGCRRIIQRWDLPDVEEVETYLFEAFKNVIDRDIMPDWLDEGRWRFNLKRLGILNDSSSTTPGWQEFKGTAKDAVFDLNSTDLSGIRPWIGYSSGVATTQSVIFSDLIPGKIYALRVYPAASSGTTAVYSASATDSGAVLIGGKTWKSPTAGSYTTPYSWKVSFKALSSTTTIKLAPKTLDSQNFIYFDYLEPSIDFQFSGDFSRVGDLEVVPASVAWDEFKSTSLSPTYTFGSSDTSSVRPWIGNSSGQLASQTFQFNNLQPNRPYILRVYPSSISSVNASFSASLEGGDGQIIGGPVFNPKIGGYPNEAMPWIIAFTSNSPSIKVKLGSANAGDYMYFDYIDARM